tara:strand:- start:136 stop:945 length:810 start_codon:yes stop_codon:yes gene_type:complete
MICKDAKDIYRYYFEVSSFFSKQNLKILKTDCHNESKIFDISIPLGPILSEGNNLEILEKNQTIINCAKKEFPTLNIIKGDIRSLSNLSKRYDLILDFSTIDHIPPSDYKEVLKNYKRLSDNISVVVWLDETDRVDGDQAYFNVIEFTECFNTTFKNTQKIIIWKHRSRQLVHFYSFTDNSFNTYFLSLKNKWMNHFNKEYLSFKKHYLGCNSKFKILMRHTIFFLTFPKIALKFDPVRYLYLNPDLVDASVEPFDHFKKFGLYENRIY